MGNHNHNHRWRSPNSSPRGARRRSSRATMRRTGKACQIESIIYEAWYGTKTPREVRFKQDGGNSGGYCAQQGIRPPLATYLGASMGTCDVYERDPFYREERHYWLDTHTYNLPST